LADLLANEKGFVIVGQAGSVREALVGIEATCQRPFFWTFRCQTVAVSKFSNSSNSIQKFQREKVCAAVAQ
jgi:hypothetical protein